MRWFDPEPEQGMTADRQENRRRMAQLVADLYDERITSSEFFARSEAFTSTNDPELGELLELVRREPANTWLFGISGEVERRNAQRIRELVMQFAGIDEPDRRQPGATDPGQERRERA